MSSVLLDTSGLIAVVNVDDQWHVAAETIWRKEVFSADHHFEQAGFNILLKR